MYGSAVAGVYRLGMSLSFASYCKDGCSKWAQHSRGWLFTKHWDFLWRSAFLRGRGRLNCVLSINQRPQSVSVGSSLNVGLVHEDVGVLGGEGDDLIAVRVEVEVILLELVVGRVVATGDALDDGALNNARPVPAEVGVVLTFHVRVIEFSTFA